MSHCMSNMAVRGGVSAVLFAAALGHAAWAQAPNAASEHVRSYQLKHATAAEIVAVLHKAHGEQKPSSAQGAAAQPGQAAQPTQPNATAPQQQPNAQAPNAQAPNAQAPNAQAPNAQAPKAGQGTAKERLHLAADGQVFYARGPVEELKRLDEAVKSLDKARGEAGGLYVVAIEGTDAKALTNLLSQLDLKTDAITCGNKTLVVALDADSHKDVEAFVAEYQKNIKNNVNSKSQPGQPNKPGQAG